MKIKLNVAYETTEKGKVKKHKKGAVVDVGDAEANRLIKAGYAVPADKPKKGGDSK